MAVLGNLLQLGRPSSTGGLEDPSTHGRDDDGSVRVIGGCTLTGNCCCASSRRG